MTNKVRRHLTMGWSLPSQVDGVPPPSLPQLPTNFCRKLGEVPKAEGAWSHQFLLERRLHRLHAAVHAEFVEDVRDMEFDRAETHHKPFRDLVVVQAVHHALEDLAGAGGQLLARDLQLRNRRASACVISGDSVFPPWQVERGERMCMFILACILFEAFDEFISRVPGPPDLEIFGVPQYCAKLAETAVVGSQDCPAF